MPPGRFGAYPMDSAQSMRLGTGARSIAPSSATRERGTPKSFCRPRHGRSGRDRGGGLLHGRIPGPLRELDDDAAAEGAECLRPRWCRRRGTRTNASHCSNDHLCHDTDQPCLIGPTGHQRGTAGRCAAMPDAAEWRRVRCEQGRYPRNKAAHRVVISMMRMSGRSVGRSNGTTTCWIRQRRRDCGDRQQVVIGNKSRSRRPTSQRARSTRVHPVADAPPTPITDLAGAR